MSANPALVQTPHGEQVPAPFPGESFLLKRPGVQLDLDGVRTATRKWSARGTLFVSNLRLVFTADKPDPSGLVGFDFPLVYIRADTLNQPIFGCNNLTGEVWPAVEGGGPAGTLPPHKFVVYFKEGGIGTFYPLYYTLAGRAKQAFAQSHASPSGQQPPHPQQQQQQGISAAGGGGGAWHDPNPAAYAEGLASRAFVDPNDPSTVYVVQPTDDSQRLPERPKYAANYGVEETYEDMAPGHGRQQG